MTDHIKEINADDYQKVVLDAPRAVVDFYSTECPPCEALASKYDALSEIYGEFVPFIKIYRQGNRDLSLSLDVTGSPTVLFYKEGKLVGDKLTGGIKRSDLMKNIEALLTADEIAAARKKIVPFETETDVVILGGGPAGLTAGIYLSQAHVKTILVDTALPGGYVATTHQVSNYPGFIEPQQGFMLSHYMSEQAKANGVSFRAAVEVNSVDLETKTVIVDDVETIRAKRVVIATGSRPRPLGLPGEDAYRGNGISYCATCDAKYFQDKDVVVIGGGNSAIEETLFIAKFAKKITIVHQFDHFQANKVAQDALRKLENVEVLLEHEPREFKKYATMDMGVVVEDLKSGEKKELRTNGIFVFVGFLPNLEMFKEGLELDQWGYLKADHDMETNIKGVYAIGDVKTKAYRQITTAVADGTIAAISISKSL